MCDIENIPMATMSHSVVLSRCCDITFARHARFFRSGLVTRPAGELKTHILRYLFHQRLELPGKSGARRARIEAQLQEETTHIHGQLRNLSDSRSPQFSQYLLVVLDVSNRNRVRGPVQPVDQRGL